MNVRGQHVRCELDAGNIALNRRGKGARKGRLADAGNVLKQQVSACGKRHDGELERLPIRREGGVEGIDKRRDDVARGGTPLGVVSLGAIGGAGADGFGHLILPWVRKACGHARESSVPIVASFGSVATMRSS